MVRVQIPFSTPLNGGSKRENKGAGSDGSSGCDEKDDDDDEAVGIMSDTDSDVDDDIGDPDWEEVKGEDDEEDQFKVGQGLAASMASLPAAGVTITLGRPRRGRGHRKGRADDDGDDDEDDDDESYEEARARKRRKREVDLNELVRKSLNRVKITEQLMRHKLSLLLYLARGLRLVKIVNCSIIRGLSLSIVDGQFKFKGKHNDRKLIEMFLEKFTEVVTICTEDDVRARHLQQPFMLNLLECYQALETTSLIELCVMFVACLKALHPSLPVRIVNVLRPVTLRANIIPKPSEEKSSQPPPTVAENLLKTETKDAEIKTEKVEPEIVEKIDEPQEQEESKTTKKHKPSKGTRNSKKVPTPATRKSSRTKSVPPPPPPPPPPAKVEPTMEICEKLDFWVEVYLKDEERWCCVDLCNIKLDEPNVLTELSRPFSYLVSYDVDRYCVKAAEKYYVENWYTPAFRKGRCEDKWWDGVLSALGPFNETEKDRADESKTEELLVKQEMPTSDTGFRNHPLYVLEKHLLKFQGIYPPEVAPMGFFKNQPVYPRDCVYTLCSRETWLRKARTVKVGDSPYKIVKARPKRDKYTGDLIRDLPLELFGEWQTEDYIPPRAENGKVPRNAYGNVDMYQPCMLPIGCAWLKLNGLHRIANKLGIDVAQAVVGFDNHCGSYGAHPVIDGYIVCEEYTDTLRAAWEEEQFNITKRQEEKRMKRVWDNWRRLIKAAMIREKLRVKYKHS